MTEERDYEREWTEAADAVAEALDADILLYNGDIDSRWDPDAKVIDLCGKRNRRPNVVLILVTYGGNPHIAYRIARCLQQKYQEVTVFISGTCMSAGTLITLGASELVISDHGRIGPLDVQVYTPDELFEYGSGLAVTEALDSLEKKAFEAFEDTLLELKMRSRGQITSKTAMEIASNLTSNLFQPIYEQIDPMRLGEIGREMRIAEEYGSRLATKSQNLKRDTLQRLVAGYSSHSFVIDREEAEELFVNVRQPTREEEALAECMGGLGREPAVLDPSAPYQRPFIWFVSTEIEPEEVQEERGADEGEELREAENGRGYPEGEQEETRPAARGSGEELPAEATQDGQTDGQGDSRA